MIFQKPTPATTGKLKERVAEQFLKAKGLNLRERNFLCKMGEIDLIMEESDTLIFVEVRYRKNSRFGSASETVDYKKQQKLIKTAQFYLQKTFKQEPPTRFDVIAISDDTNNPIEWIRNAISA